MSIMAAGHTLPRETPRCLLAEASLSSRIQLLFSTHHAPHGLITRPLAGEVTRVALFANGHCEIDVIWDEGFTARLHSRSSLWIAADADRTREDWDDTLALLCYESFD